MVTVYNISYLLVVLNNKLEKYCPTVTREANTKAITHTDISEYETNVNSECALSGG